MVALGMVRLAYSDRSLPDPVTQCHRLGSLPPGTMVRAVLGGQKVELGQVNGMDRNGNLKFGPKRLSPTHCADISPVPWVKPTWRENRVEITFDSAFIQNMVPSATPELFASEARTICMAVGPKTELGAEAELLVARPTGAVQLRPLHEILRPFESYGQMGWHSVICSSQSIDWPDVVVAKRPRLVILDGASAVQRWISETYDAEIVLALVHRSDSSAVSAAEVVLNQRRSAQKFDLRQLGWTPSAAVEAVAFGEPV